MQNEKAVLEKGTKPIQDVFNFFAEMLEYFIQMDNNEGIRKTSPLLEALSHIKFFYPDGIVKILIDSGVITYYLEIGSKSIELFKIHSNK